MSVVFHTRSVADEALDFLGCLGEGLDRSSMPRSRKSTQPREEAQLFVHLGVLVGTVATNGPTLMPLGLESRVALAIK